MNRLLRIAVPSRTSRLHSVADRVLAQLFPVDAELAASLAALPRRRLVATRTPHSVLIECRGTDVPYLVALGVADIGLTGYDMAVEGALQAGKALEIRSLAPARTSFVCFATVPGRADVRRLYTEYPYTAAKWARSTRRFRDADVVPLHGSLEGVVNSDPVSAAFVLMTTGETLQANDLRSVTPILVTDLCLVRRQGDTAEIPDLQLAELPILALPRFCTDAAA